MFMITNKDRREASVSTHQTLVKVGSHTKGRVHATTWQVPQRVHTKGLVTGIFYTNSSHQAFWGTTSRKSNCFEFVRTQLGNFKWQMASSHDETCTLSPRLVIGTRPLVCVDLTERRHYNWYFLISNLPNEWKLDLWQICRWEFLVQSRKRNDIHEIAHWEFLLG